MSNQNQEKQENGQNDVFIKVTKKQGPRGQRLEKRRQNDRQTNEQSDRPQREGLSYRDLLFQFNNLQKRIDSPKVDLVENGDHYIVKMEVPGLKKEDLNIKLKDSQFLLVSGDKNEECTEETQDSNGHTIVYKESKYGSFTRRVKLPTLIKYKNGISSSIEDGVLTVICTKEDPNLKYEKKQYQQKPYHQKEPYQKELQKPYQKPYQKEQKQNEAPPQQESEPQKEPQGTEEKVINWSDL